MMPVQEPSIGRIGLGTYKLGSQTMFACLKALEIGYRHIDTASLYRNEKQVAEAIERSQLPRQEVFVTSKIKAKDIKSGDLKAATKKSLEHLGSIDLLLLHAPTHNLVYAWEQMLEISQWQEIGEVGVSNFDVCHLKQLLPMPAWNQIEITPFCQRLDLVRYCQQQEIEIIAHSPLVKAQKLLDKKLQLLAQSLNITTAQLLIAWSLAKGYFVLPRSRNPIHLQENFNAASLKLPEQIVEKLDLLEAGYATHPQHFDARKNLV